MHPRVLALGMPHPALLARQALARAGGRSPGARLLVLERAPTASPDTVAGEVAAAMLAA